MRPVGDPPQSSDREITCVVVDDHPGLVAAVSAVLGEIGVAVVGRAQGAREAITQIERTQPTLALVDVHLGETSGLALTREISKVSPATRVVIYTGYVDHALLNEALDAGAAGVVLKEAPMIDLVRAIEMVADGQTYLDPVLAGEAVLRPQGRPVLTNREREILRMLADGLGNEQIGSKLFISPETVRTHIRTAMSKLGATTRTQAVAEAIRHDLIG